MENKPLNKELEILSRVQNVDAPAFMLTRILSKIENRTVQKVSSFKLAFASAFALILITGNLFAFSNSTSSTSDLSEYIEEINISSNNHFYE